MLNLSSVTPRVSHSAGATNEAGGREETNSKPPRVGVEIYELTLSRATHRTEFFLPIRRNLNHRHEWAGQCVLCYPEPLQCKKKAFCLRVTDGGTFPLLEELRPRICGKLAGLDGAEKDSPTYRQHCINTDNTTLSSVLSTRISALCKTLSQEHGGNRENMKKKKKPQKKKSIFFCCILRFFSGVCTYSISQTLLGTGINWGQCKSSGD